jgi:hypothetical protein
MKRISDPRKFRSPPPKAFFNSIGRKAVINKTSNVGEVPILLQKSVEIALPP